MPQKIQMDAQQVFGEKVKEMLMMIPKGSSITRITERQTQLKGVCKGEIRCVDSRCRPES